MSTYTVSGTELRNRLAQLPDAATSPLAQPPIVTTDNLNGTYTVTIPNAYDADWLAANPALDPPPTPPDSSQYLPAGLPPDGVYEMTVSGGVASWSPAGQSTTTVAPSSILSPPALTTSVNNWNPTNFATSVRVLRVAATANVDITGLVPAGNYHLLTVLNIGPADVKLKNQSANSGSANRFAIDADITLKAGLGRSIFYDPSFSGGRWVAV